MPKRPLSAYNIFFKEEREKLLEEQRRARELGIGFANLAKTVAAKWKQLSDEEKVPFQVKAAEEKASYKIAVAKWRANQKTNKKGKSAKHDEPGTPKTPSSGDSDAVHAFHQEDISSIQSDRSLESFARHGNDHYPSQWFQVSGGSPPRPVPSIVNAMNDESSRTGASSISDDPLFNNMPYSLAPRSYPMGWMAYNQDPMGSFYQSQINEPITEPGLLASQGQARIARATSMRQTRDAQMAQDFASIQGHMEDLRRSRASIAGSNAASFTMGYPGSNMQAMPTMQPRSSSLPGFGTPQALSLNLYPPHHPQPSFLMDQAAFHMSMPSMSSMPASMPPPPQQPMLGSAQSMREAALQVPPPLSAPPPLPPPSEQGAEESCLEEEEEADQEQVESEEKIDTPLHFELSEAGLPATAMRSLSDNLDEDAIDFLTSARFEDNPPPPS